MKTCVYTLRSGWPAPISLPIARAQLETHTACLCSQYEDAQASQPGDAHIMLHSSQTADAHSCKYGDTDHRLGTLETFIAQLTS